MKNISHRLQRDESLDFLKGSLILLVVFGHAIQFVVYAKTATFWDDPLFRAIYAFHMPAFITISGLLAAPRIGPQLSAARLFGSRVWPILAPLLVWSTIVALPLAAKVAGRGAPEAVSAWINTFLGGYWFLWAVIAGAILAWLAACAGRHAGAAAVGLAVAVILVPIDGYAFPEIRATVPFYLAGFLLGRAGLTLAAIPIPLAIASAIVAALGATAWERQTYIYNNDLAYWQAGMLGQIGLMALVWTAGTIAFLRLGVALHGRLRETLVGRTLAVVGTRTLEIYLAQAAIFVVALVLPPLPLPRLAGYLLAAAVTGGMIAAICAVSAWLRDRPALDRVVWGRVQRG